MTEQQDNDDAGDEQPEETLSASDRTAQRDEAMRESTKGLLWINGGGAAAMLALLQEVMLDQRVFATFIVFGISSFIVGLALAARVQYHRFFASQSAQFKPENHRHYYGLYIKYTTRSLYAFMFGSVIVVIGALISIWCWQ